MRKIIGFILTSLVGLQSAAYHPAYAGEITVSAASSLTQAFKEIALGFEKNHPQTKVQFNFGGSGALLQQVLKGAPVDVLATADQETMAEAVKQGLIISDARRNFARNSLVLIVPADNKTSTNKLGKLADLTQSSVQRIAIGQPASVPAGRYSQHALEAAKLWTVLQSKLITTQNVRQSLDYVARGEVEAGFVYATDAALMPEKVRIAFTVPLEQTILYPIAPIRGSSHRTEAQQWVDYILSPAAQAVLKKHGFQNP